MSTMLPQKLYKYCAFGTQSLRLLSSAEAYYADPRRFNDPLDCRPSVQLDVDQGELERLCYKLLRQTKEREAAIATINELRYLPTGDLDGDNGSSREDYLKRLFGRAIERLLAAELGEKGVLSLSAIWNSPLMWSYYGDQHRGICIEYDTSDLAHSDIAPVNYEASRSIKASDLIKWKLDGSAEAERRAVAAHFFVKAPERQYEKEWRGIAATSGVRPSKLRITGVHFGFRCDYSVRTAVVKLYSGHQDIDLYQIYPDDSFHLLRREVDCGELEVCGVREPALPSFRSAAAVPDRVAAF
jgi:hypothetical protein